jgi:hypothetical protein
MTLLLLAIARSNRAAKSLLSTVMPPRAWDGNRVGPISRRIEEPDGPALSQLFLRYRLFLE